MRSFFFSALRMVDFERDGVLMSQGRPQLLLCFPSTPAMMMGLCFSRRPRREILLVPCMGQRLKNRFRDSDEAR